MFKKGERCDKAAFKKIFTTAKRHHFPHFLILTTNSQPRKAAVVVGKKVAKTAARRNTLRRRVYALLREELMKTNHPGGFVVLVKPSFNTLPRKTAYELLRKSIAEVIKTA